MVVLFRVFTTAYPKVDLTREYWNNVFQPSLRVWETGDTPNPDVWCNKSAFLLSTQLEAEIPPGKSNSER